MITLHVIIACGVSVVIGAVITYCLILNKIKYFQSLYQSLYEEHTITKEMLTQKEERLLETSNLLSGHQAKLEFLETEKNKLDAQKIEAFSAKLNLNERVTALTAHNEFYQSQRQEILLENSGLKQKIEMLERNNQNILDIKNETEVKLNSIFSDNKHLYERLEEQKHEFSRLQQEQEHRLENIANKIFQEKTQIFSQQSEKTLHEALSPVKDKLGEFHKLVHDKFAFQTGEQLVLKEELKRIIQINEKMTFQADSLTKALRGDNKIMGNWGEMMLERILEDSGLNKDIDYVLQASGYQLKDEAGKRQIPDAIVQLPDQKHIIIDAKVSLVDFERYLQHSDDQAIHQKNFLKSVRSHIDNLAAKQYYQNDQLLSPDFVLLFMPIEGAYSLAMQLDLQLHNYAWDKRIAIVSATTLFATLRTVASLWRIEKQNKNAQEIARRSGMIFEKFCNFIEDLKKVDHQLDQANSFFDKAMNKLYKGKGNIVSQMNTLKTLGAKTSKSLPITNKDYLLDDEYDADQTDADITNTEYNPQPYNNHEQNQATDTANLGDYHDRISL